MTLCYTDFTLFGGYPKYTFSLGKISAERRGLLPWDMLDAFIMSQLPPSTYAGGSLVTQKGAPFPGRNNLRVVSIEANAFCPRTTDLDVNSVDYKHEYWDVSIKYETDADSYLTHQWSAGGEAFTVEAGSLCWDRLPEYIVDLQVVGSFLVDPNSDGADKVIGVKAQQKEVASPRLIVPHIEHQITWHRVVRPPYKAIRACIGKVNNADVDFRTGKIPKECLLLTGVNIVRNVMTDGNFSIEIVYRFSERRVVAMDNPATEPGGWNHFYKSSPPRKIDRVYGNAGGTVLDICSGRPGFYRLEKYMGKNDASTGCNPPFNNQGNQASPGASGGGSTIGGVSYSVNQTQGYQKETAIYEQEDFAKLFQPEDPTEPDPPLDPGEPPTP